MLFTFLATGLHAYLTQKYFNLQNAEASGQSICNLGGMWNCDAVNTSTYSNFLGSPVALWGFTTHLVFFLCQVMVAMRQEVRNLWADLTVLLSLLIAGASVVMGLISLTQIGSLCLFCFIAYALSFLNIILLKLSGLDLLAPFKNCGGILKEKASWMLIVAIPLFVFILNSSWGGSLNSASVKGLVSDRIAAWVAAPISPLDLNLGLRLGASLSDAKMTIVEFADFRCPHCKHAAPSIKAFTQSRKDVALVFKAYPLDGTCNNDENFQGRGDGISCRLAFAVFCAEKLEQKGWQFFNSIFENQENYHRLGTVEEVDESLCKTGISDCEKLKLCMADDGTKLMIQQMAQEGTQAGLKGTPTFYVNNKLLNGAQFLPVLEKAYEVIKK